VRNSIFGALFIGLMALACAGTSAEPLSSAAREPGVVYFVENHGQDQRNLEQIIAGIIAARGIEVTAGGPGQRPPNATFIVTYEDRWGWDMRTFLRDIKIDVHEAKTGQVVGTSRSYQDSLSAMGQTYQEIIERTANGLFETPP
jgi:hypothetical protein